LLIIAGIFVLPRMMHRPQARVTTQAPPKVRRIIFSGKVRLAIFSSALWLAATAAYFQPWKSGWVSFGYAGVGAVAAIWGAAWVIRGFQRRSH
jgi:hypothetical protein